MSPEENQEEYLAEILEKAIIPQRDIVHGTPAGFVELDAELAAFLGMPPNPPMQFTERPIRMALHRLVEAGEYKQMWQLVRPFYRCPVWIKPVPGVLYLNSYCAEECAFLAELPIEIQTIWKCEECGRISEAEPLGGTCGCEWRVVEDERYHRARDLEKTGACVIKPLRRHGCDGWRIEAGE